MKAAVCFEPNSRLDVVQVEQEAPRAGEARVKVMAAGIVREVGPGVSNVKPGDHINEGFTAMRSGQVARGVVVFD